MLYVNGISDLDCKFFIDLGLYIKPLRRDDAVAFFYVLLTITLSHKKKSRHFLCVSFRISTTKLQDIFDIYKFDLKIQ